MSYHGFADVQSRSPRVQFGGQNLKQEGKDEGWGG